MRLWLRNGLILFTLLGFYVICYSALLDLRASSVEISKHPVRWDIPPVVLAGLAGEFKGLVADLIVLEAGAHLGAEVVRDSQGGFRTVKKDIDWNAMVRLFTNSQALDPSFQQTFTLAQGWLPWAPAKKVEETQAILKTAAQGRPWDWQPLHFYGFNTYYFLNKPGEAGKVFLEAAKAATAPPFLAILGARLAQQGGETAAAIAVMKSMLADKKKTDEPGYDDMRDRLHALEGVLTLEQAVQKHEQTVGKKPDSLEDLTANGILEILPANPYHLPYCMDTNGTIFFDKPNCRPLDSRP